MVLRLQRSETWMILLLTMAGVRVAGIAFLAWAIRRLHRKLEGKPASAVVVSTP